jgi:hypothetical protein
MSQEKKDELNRKRRERRQQKNVHASGKWCSLRVGCEVPVFIFKHVDDGVEMIGNDIMWGHLIMMDY